MVCWPETESKQHQTFYCPTSVAREMGDGNASCNDRCTPLANTGGAFALGD